MFVLKVGLKAHVCVKAHDTSFTKVNVLMNSAGLDYTTKMFFLRIPRGGVVYPLKLRRSSITGILEKLSI